MQRIGHPHSWRILNICCKLVIAMLILLIVFASPMSRRQIKSAIDTKKTMMLISNRAAKDRLYPTFDS